METEIPVHFDVTRRGYESAYVDYEEFDVAKEALEAIGYRVASLGELAQLRMQEGAHSSLCLHYDFVREGVLYLPDKGRFLTKKSPVMKNPVIATNEHRNKREFYLIFREDIEEALSNSVRLNPLLIPTNRFGDDEITNFAFGYSARAYGEFLAQEGIEEMLVDLDNTEERPFATQVQLGGLGKYTEDGGINHKRSRLDCRSLDLSDGGRVYGVINNNDLLQDGESPGQLVEIQIGNPLNVLGKGIERLFRWIKPKQ